jgi:predicted Zn-dependent protease
LNKKLLLILLFFITVSSCKEEVTEPTRTFVDRFYGTTTALNIQVAYEEDAAPNLALNSEDAFDITKDNVNALLEGKNINLTVPMTLEDMVYLGNFQQESFTLEEITAIANDVQQFTNEDSEKGIVALFLDGYYNKDGEVLEGVIGLNINGTPIVAMFKPVIESASNSYTINTLVEQTTLTHELGHALGLVDNGVALTTSHKDEDHGAHCTNEDCIMYWQNGGGNVVEFVMPFVTGGAIELFGTECLNDVAAK